MGSGGKGTLNNILLDEMECGGKTALDLKNMLLG